MSSDSRRYNRRRKTVGRRRVTSENDEVDQSSGLDDVGGKYQSRTDEAVPLAVEMCMKQEPTDVEDDISKNMPCQSNLQSLDIDARLAELEHLAAIKLCDVEHAIELEEDIIDGESNADNRWYGKVAEIGEESENQLPAAHQPGRAVQLYGSPDPRVPPSQVPCHGCGVHLHCVDPGIAGYIPSQIFVAASRQQLKDILCQRCYLLEKFNIAVDVAVNPMEFKTIAVDIKKQSAALLIVIVDLTDLPNSFYDGFAELANEHFRPIYIIGNKVDLLPRDDARYLTRVKESLSKLCAERGFAPKRVSLISAKTGYGVENLITQLLLDWRLKGQVYILGCTNAGKSSLFNALLSSDFCRLSARDVIQRATASNWPGTTLSLLKFPIVNPKPARLFDRIERLKQQRSEAQEEEKLRRELLKETGRSKYATLMGYIGLTSQSPRQAALEKCIEQRYPSGFLAPSYSFDEDTSSKMPGETTDSKTWLEDFVGREAIVERLKFKVDKYNDKTFKFWCYDTPGIVNPNQVINHLNSEELMAVLSRNIIIPRTFRLKPAHVLFVSGLGRLDYTKGDESIYCTVFAARSIPVHVMSCEDSEVFYRTNIGTSTLGVPLGNAERLNMIEQLVGREFTVSGIGFKESAADIVLSSVGWVSITAGPECVITLTGYTPGGLGCTLRSPALLKYAVNLRGKRIRKTYAYHTRAPKFCSDR